MSKYVFYDVSCRLEDLDNYLDDLETQLDNARDAQRELIEMVEELSKLEKLEEHAEDIKVDPHLHADLLTYVQANSPGMDYKTEAMFSKLSALLTNLEEILA